MIKPSQILRRAAALVTAYNEGDMTVKCKGSTSWHWEFGCHAISCAAYEAGIIEGTCEGQVLLCSQYKLEKMIPHVFGYFLQCKPVGLEEGRSAWFDFDKQHERVEALHKAADLAELDGN